MNVLKTIFGKVWNDPNAAELAQISAGQLYLVRSDNIKASRECIFQNAMITVRRAIISDFHYQLVVTRVFEEGEELLLDEDDETDQERSFLIDEALQFNIGAFEGETTFQWRDLEDDEDDMFEFVASEVDATTISAFQLAVYRAMYERKYAQSSASVSDANLKREFALRNTVTGRAQKPPPQTNNMPGGINQLTSKMEDLRVETSTADSRPKLVCEPAVLYTWNDDRRTFEREGEVEATIIQNGPYEYWLRASGPKTFASHQISNDLNARFATPNKSIIWNQFTMKQILVSYCLRFDSQDSFLRFKEAFARYQYEALNHVSWDKVKLEDRKYTVSSYDDGAMLVVREEGEDGEEDEEDEEQVAEELGLDEEEEEEDDFQYDEEIPQAKAFRMGGKNKQLVVSKYRSYVENEGRIGVFKNDTEMGELQYIATINKLLAPRGRAFRPKKMMLHNQDASLVLQNPDAPHSLFNLDIETGKVVEEWKVHDDVNVDHIAPVTKFSQVQPERTLVGASHNALFRVDPRLSGNKMVDAEYKQYTTNSKFSGIASTAAGKYAVVSEKGDIRLYDKLGKNAKTALPALGDPIVGVDVTANGRYIVATTKTYLLLIDTLIGTGRYQGQLGFDRSFPADAKPMPKRLQLKPEHLAYMGGDVSFTPARFNSTEEGQDENTIVTGNGQFVIAWDFNKVKRGQLNKYDIKWYPNRVVQDDFKYGTDKDIIVALEDNVLATNKKQLKPATRRSLGGHGTSHSNIVNSPY